MARETYGDAMQDAFAHCTSLVRAADKDRYLASLFASADRRAALMALYAFNIEVTRIAERVQQPLAGAIRLQWWREVLAGDRAGEAEGHPVAAALLRTVAAHDLPFAAFDALLEAHAFDTDEAAAMATSAELATYARHTAATIFALAARILDPHAVAALAPLVAAGGIAYAYTGLMLALPAHAARGKLYLPWDVLERHGAAPEDLLAGRRTAQLDAALADLRGQAREELASFDQGVTEIPASAAPAVLPVALVGARLARMERPDWDPLRPTDIAPWRRQWILWRAARRLRRPATRPQSGLRPR